MRVFADTGNVYSEAIKLLINGETTNICVYQTANMWQRMRGLLFHTELYETEALLIQPCPSIHTWGMRYPLDVVFVNEAGRVMKIVRGLKPYRTCRCRGARAVYEFAKAPNLKIGDKLTLQETLKK